MMIKTSEQIFKEFDYQIPLGTPQENKDIYNFQRKEWVDKEKLSNKLEWVTYALEYDMFDEKKADEYLMKVIDNAKKLLDDLNKELMNDD